MKFHDRAILVGVTLLWGFNFVIIRWGLESVDPFLMTGLRFLLVALPAVFFVKRPVVSMFWVGLYGLMFGGGVWGLVILSVSWGTAAGLAAILLQMSAFLSVIAGLALFKEKLSIWKGLGILLAFAGFAAIVSSRSGGASLAGVALVLAAAVFWTACNTLIRMVKPVNFAGFIVWSSLFVPIPFFLLSSWADYGAVGGAEINATLGAIGIRGWVSIASQAFLTTLLGYTLWTRAITRYGLADVAPFSLLVPVSGLFFGHLIYDEMLSLPEAVGAGLILAGLAFLFVRKGKPSKTHDGGQ